MYSLFKTEEGQYVPGGQPWESLPESSYAFLRVLLLNSRFPHYLGAWSRLVVWRPRDFHVTKSSRFVSLKSSLKLNITKDGM